jgi:RNA polymerase sigma-70 factor (ECF subfamily)
MSKNTYEGIDPELVRIVKKTAKRAIGKAGFTQNDLPDIEQELMLSALNGLKRRRTNVENGTAFIQGIVNNQLKQLFRKENSKSKSWRQRRISLNISVELDSGDLEELINLLDTECLLRNTSFYAPDPYQYIDLATNINSLIRTLPLNFQEFCEDLKKQPVRELIRERNLNARIVRKIIRHIRKDLKKQESLSLYLQ